MNLVDQIAEVSAAHANYTHHSGDMFICKCGESFLWQTNFDFNAHEYHRAAEIAKVVRPRVETQAELDALPVRTVLKEEFETGNGAIWERWHGDTWVRLDSAPHIPGRIPFLPAILLYTPGDTE